MCNSHHPPHDHETAAERQLDAAGAEMLGSTEQLVALKIAEVEANLAQARALGQLAAALAPHEVREEMKPVGPYSITDPEQFQDVLTDAFLAGWEVSFDYEREDGSDAGRRRVEPQEVFLNRNRQAVLLAADPQRDGDYRAFRLDRMSHLTVEAA